MYLRHNSRFRYVLHTLIHDPKPITTDPVTMYDDPDMISAALCTLMQTSLRSGYDPIGDICPDHIDICAHHCRSLVLAHRYHGSSIRCPAFGSSSETACHSRATDYPGTSIPMEERRQLNWPHCQQKRSNRSSSEQTKKIALPADQFGTS